MPDKNLSKRLSDLEDKAAIKDVVDTFSNLADQKDIQKQVLLFTEDASVISVMQGKANPPLVGRKQIGEAFSAYLNLFETVYHINGQQTVTLAGDKASGVSYCIVMLIGTQDNKRVQTTMGVYYYDDFVKKDGHWLIEKRNSHFVWREVQPYNG